MDTRTVCVGRSVRACQPMADTILADMIRQVIRKSTASRAGQKLSSEPPPESVGARGLNPVLPVLQSPGTGAFPEHSCNPSMNLSLALSPCPTDPAASRIVLEQRGQSGHRGSSTGAALGSSAETALREQWEPEKPRQRMSWEKTPSEKTSWEERRRARSISPIIVSSTPRYRCRGQGLLCRGLLCKGLRRALCKGPLCKGPAASQITLAA